jgi:hypothetical protein
MTLPMNRARLIKKYQNLVDEHVYYTPEMPTQILWCVAKALEEGQNGDYFTLERDLNMQHMDPTYFKAVKWVWNDAIKVARKEEEARKDTP